MESKILFPAIQVDAAQQEISVLISRGDPTTRSGPLVFLLRAVLRRLRSESDALTCG